MAYYFNEATFTDELIAFILSCRSNSIRKQILWERINKRHNISKKYYDQHIYRLKSRGYLRYKNGEYFLSDKAKNYFNNPYKKITKKNGKSGKILVIFDIPESNKKAREWVREQLKFWGFKMIQKSIWAGGGPLPKEFNERLKALKIRDGVKILKVQTKQ